MSNLGRKHSLFFYPWLRMALLAACLLGVSQAARAANICTASGTSTVTFGSVTVPRDLAVGSNIGTAQTQTVSISCPQTIIGMTVYFRSLQATSSTVSNVWETGVAGIGVRVTSTGVTSTLSSVASGSTGTLINVGALASYSGTLTFTYQLVKTASTVTASSTISTNVFNLMSKALTVVGDADITTIMTPSASASIVARTCTVTTSSIAVALPTVKASTLGTVGTTAGTTSFNIGLSCSSGAGVYVTLTDATDTGNTTSYLTLASGSTASGVKLRLLHNGTAVSFGPDSALAGNTNQWYVGDSGSVSSIPLSAQYISTGTVTAGAVKGLATFTLSYQ